MANEERTPVSQEEAQPRKKNAFVRFWDTVLGPYEDRLRPRKYDALRTEVEGFLAATDPELLTQKISTCADMITQGVPTKQLETFLEGTSKGEIGRQVIILGGILELDRRSTGTVREALKNLQERQAGSQRQLEPDEARDMSQIEESLGDLDQIQRDAIAHLMDVVDLTRTSLRSLSDRLQSE